MRGIKARLQKVEAAYPRTLTMFLVWGETDEAAERAFSQHKAAGDLQDVDLPLALAWPGPDPMPPSRRTDVEGLSPMEVDVLCGVLRAELGGLNHAAASMETV
jgi:hypothetical protein